MQKDSVIQNTFQDLAVQFRYDVLVLAGFNKQENMKCVKMRDFFDAHEMRCLKNIETNAYGQK